MPRYKLTQEGIHAVENFIEKCKAIQEFVVLHRLDTVEDTDLPTIEDFESDIMCFAEDGAYFNGWGITDNYSYGSPVLVEGKHYIKVCDK